MMEQNKFMNFPKKGTFYRGKKILLISSLLGANLFALNIDSAVQLSLKNNFSLKEQEFIVDENKANLESSYSAFRPKLDVNYTYNDRDKLIPGQIKKDTTLTGTISYNLFNGFSDSYNVNSYENLFESSEFTYNAKKQDTVLDTKKAYINYLLKTKETKTMEEAYKLYQKQYNDSKNFFDQGLVAKNELLEVEVEMLTSKQNLQNAKKEQTIARIELENVLAISLPASETIEELENFNNISFVYDEKRIENRSEIKALSLIMENYKNKLKAVNGTYVPKIDASYKYNEFGDSVSLNGREDYPSSQEVGTITVSWNLYNGGSDTANRVIYNKKVKQTLMQLEDLKLQIKLQYKKALEEYNVAKLNFETASKALESSKLNYEIVQDKFSEGLSNNKDLLDANYLLTNAKQNYFNAYYNKYLLVATLQRILEVNTFKQ